MAEPSVSPLRLLSVKLHGIRSYLHAAELQVRPLTIICGTNGSGKTTWFDALDAARELSGRDRVPPRDETLLNAALAQGGKSRFQSNADGLPGTIEVKLRTERAFDVVFESRRRKDAVYVTPAVTWPKNTVVSVRVHVGRLGRGTVLGLHLNGKPAVELRHCRKNGTTTRYTVYCAVETLLSGGHSPDALARLGELVRGPRSIRVTRSTTGRRNYALARDLVKSGLFLTLWSIENSIYHLGAIRRPEPALAGSEHDVERHRVGAEGGSAQDLLKRHGREQMAGTYTFNAFCDAWLRNLVGVARSGPTIEKPPVGKPVGFLDESPLGRPLALSSGKRYRLGRMELAHPHFYASKFLPRVQELRQLSTGFHQVAPIVIEAGLMRKGETLLIENPEVHLHPGAQLKVTEFLIEMAKSGRQIIVETHSDLVIRRVLRAILQEDIPQQAVNIYFTSVGKDAAGNATSKLEKIRFSEKTRQVENWPAGFLDDDVQESRRLLETMYGPPPQGADDGDANG